MRAAVSMPRSPTSTTRLSPKRRRSLSTWAGTVAGSAVLPAHTSAETGRPAASHSRHATTDLAAAALAVAGVAAAGQLAVLAGVPDGGQVVQREAAVLQVAAGQLGLDGGLAAGQPVEGVVELLLGDGAQAEGLVEDGELGVGSELAGGGEARGG